MVVVVVRIRITKSSPASSLTALVRSHHFCRHRAAASAAVVAGMVIYVTPTASGSDSGSIMIARVILVCVLVCVDSLAERQESCVSQSSAPSKRQVCEP